MCLAISGTIPAKLCGMGALKVLDISNTVISGTLPQRMDLLHALDQLYVRGTKISGSIPANLAGHATLTVVDAGKTAISGTLPHEFQWMGHLLTQKPKFIQFESLPRLSGTLPEGLVEVVYFDRLNLVRASSCPFSMPTISAGESRRRI